MSFFKNQQVLVTGGAGFIGSNLVNRLLQEGARVRVLDNLSTGKKDNLQDFLRDIELQEASICDDRALEKSMKDCTLVFHAAAVPSVPRSVREPVLSMETNLMGSLKIFEAARKAKKVERIVFSASSSAYGETTELPKHEMLAPQPLSPYAVGKLATEQLGAIYTNLFQLGVISLRYFNVYGPRQDPESEYAAVIPAFIKAMHNQKAPIIYGDGQQTRDFTFVDDVVEANFLAAKSRGGLGEVFNIGGGRKTSIIELVQTLSRITGCKAPPQHQPKRDGDVKDSYASIEKAGRILEWHPQTSLEDGLKKTVSWFEKHERKSP